MIPLRRLLGESKTLEGKSKFYATFQSDEAERARESAIEEAADILCGALATRPHKNPEHDTILETHIHGLIKLQNKPVVEAFSTWLQNHPSHWTLSADGWREPNRIRTCDLLITSHFDFHRPPAYTAKRFVGWTIPSPPSQRGKGGCRLVSTPSQTRTVRAQAWLGIASALLARPGFPEFDTFSPSGFPARGSLHLKVSCSTS